MLCTNNDRLLKSIPGHVALGYTPPKGIGLKYNPDDKNLVVTWDIFMQAFRQVPIESVTLISAIPLTDTESIDRFWEFFAKRMQNMSAQEKEDFMGR